MSDGRIPLLVLNREHDVLCQRGSKGLEPASFICAANEPRESGLRSFIAKKLSVSSIRIMGWSEIAGKGICPAVIVLDENFLPPKGLEFVTLKKILKENQDSFELYTKIILQGFVPESREIVAWPMGENELDGALLSSMIARGLKLGSSSLLLEYGKDQDLLPRESGISVIIDWESQPICVIQTEKVYITPFGKVTSEQARADALGDGSLSYWQDVHWELFEGICSDAGEEMGDDLDVVCERFVCLKTLIPVS